MHLVDIFHRGIWSKKKKSGGVAANVFCFDILWRDQAAGKERFKKKFDILTVHQASSFGLGHGERKSIQVDSHRKWMSKTIENHLTSIILDPTCALGCFGVMFSAICFLDVLRFREGDLVGCVPFCDSQPPLFHLKSVKWWRPAVVWVRGHRSLSTVVTTTFRGN